MIQMSYSVNFFNLKPWFLRGTEEMSFKLNSEINPEKTLQALCFLAAELRARNAV
jgi:hypothetical protein